MKALFLLPAVLLLASCHNGAKNNDTESVELKPSVYSIIDLDSADGPNHTPKDTLVEKK